MEGTPQREARHWGEGLTKEFQGLGQQRWRAMSRFNNQAEDTGLSCVCESIPGMAADKGSGLLRSKI